MTHFLQILEDISGNSFIENPFAPQTDSNCKIHHFTRNKEQDHELGIYTKQEVINITFVVYLSVQNAVIGW